MEIFAKFSPQILLLMSMIGENNPYAMLHYGKYKLKKFLSKRNTMFKRIGNKASEPNQMSI